jgi:hypothetical protein
MDEYDEPIYENEYDGDYDYDEPKKDNPYFNHYDYQYTQSLTQLDIKKESNELLPVDKYIFCYKKASNRYEIIEPTDINNIRTKKFLYEIVNSETAIRFYIDLDVKDETKLSYNEILNLISHFKEYLKLNYDYDTDINYKIHISLTNQELNNNVYNINDKWITSTHIIFNIITDNVIQLKQIFRNFKNTKAPLTEYIDLMVYSYRKKFRTLYQSKEQVFKNEPVSNKIFYKFKIIDDLLIQDKTITDEDFVSYIIPNGTDKNMLLTTENKQIFIKDLNNFIKIEIDECIIKLNYNNYNIHYQVNQLDQLEKHINKLDDKNLLITFYWINQLRLVIACLILSNIEWNNILNHPLIQLFLNKSKIGKYDNNNCYENNVSFINSIIDKKELKQHYQNKFYEPLKEKEIFYIYKSLSLNKTEPIIITTKKINKEQYNHIYYGATKEQMEQEIITDNYNDEIEKKKKETEKQINRIRNNKPIKQRQKTDINVKKALYNPTNQILLDKYIIKEITIQEKTKDVIYSNHQYQLAIEEIKNNEIEKEEYVYNCNEIIDLNDVIIDPNLNQYLTAPVGAGKSYFVMRKDIDIVLKDANNKIQFITDTISMAEKTYQDVLNVITELGYDSKIIKFYNDKSKSHITKINDNIKILIVCYDSIYKYKIFRPTHLFIDEFVNVCKRIPVIKKVGNDKDDIRNYFFSLFKSCIIKLYDADIENNILRIIKKQYNININIVSLINYTQYNNNIIFSNVEKTKKDILDCLKNNYNITISSSADPKKHLLRLMDDLYKETKCKMITIYGEGAIESGSNENVSKKLKKELCKDTTKWNEYRVILYSPAITTGISFNQENYFYKHFHFIQPLTADATQNAQMIYRIRKNLTKTIQIAVMDNRINTLKNLQILNILHKRKSNFKIFNDNIINNYNNPLMSIEFIKPIEDMKKKPQEYKTEDDLTIHQSIQNIEEYYDRTKKYKIIYNLFQKCFKYGSKKIICKFYDTIDEPINQNQINQIEQIQLTEEEYKTLCISKFHKSFKDAEYLKSIKDDEDEKIQDEYDFSKDKTYCLKEYNYSYSLWNYHNKLKECYNLLIKYEQNDTKLEIKNILKEFNNDYDEIKVINNYESEDVNKLIHYLLNYNTPNEPPKLTEPQEYINNIDYTYDCYDDKMFSLQKTIYQHNQKFKKCSNISYYEIKDIIYLMFSKSFKSQMELLKLKTELFYTNDLNNYLKFIYGLYISFKILDLLQVNNNQLEQLYLNNGNTKLGLKLNKKDNKIQLEQLFKETDNHFNFLLSITDTERYKKDKQYKQQLTTAFNIINLDVEVGTEKDEYIYFFMKENSFKYRIQKTRLVSDITELYNNEEIEYDDDDDYNEEYKKPAKLIINKTNDGLTINDRDDLYYWLNDNRIIQEKTLFQNVIKISSLPKILLYNHHINNIDYNTNEIKKNKAPTNKYANADYLVYCIEMFCNDKDEILKLLNETNTIISNKFIEVNKYKYEKPIIENQLCNIESNKQDEKNKKIVKKEEKKEENKQKRKETHNDKILCECGVEYNKSHKSRHFNTNPTHLKYCETI